ncbi:MAG: Glu-tRNA(Gln) amidotransferase subunit GatE [Candidatus Nezhaarchaeales archaeon]|nr:MAG: Glu-tRNA(Gln) amidotransferase GatDE subunit E [Candidatus Nezhaarchaeota archaeon WYZ-LMO8]TDA36813.1 MAG: Glu-tRNA(Gln) amidotransferase GatDE subunit E [Candidatus Nezhaarchaeota archaeon WYZ-LMO7]
MVRYEELGLKVGLELHQQLNTKFKLFCSCPTVLRDDEPDVVFIRRLRPTRSELGAVDEAALLEYEKGKTYVYQAYSDTTCLVEMDEEPPHSLNEEALDTALQVALMLKAHVPDVIQVMRKVVIDGSNTTGFQRTAIIALGGPESVIQDPDGPVHIQAICLEEDAARKIAETEDKVVFRLDRLGIPLIEISTAPEIKTPEQAQRVALKIGQLLRILGKVKRGLGTIRQDVNISLKEGGKIEIKGVQDLELISKVIEFEVQRQLKLLEIRDKLKERGVTNVESDIIDATDVFKNTKSKIILQGVQRGHKVMAIRLKGFSGLLGLEVQPDRRFGTELKDYAIVWGGVKGIFHTDEMPAYGVTEAEVNELKRKLNCGPTDAAVFVVDEEEKAVKALQAVLRRCKEALNGIPDETRAANPDGTTRYMRPRPGASRMYPETDVRPIIITRERLERLSSSLPEMPEQKLRRFIEEYGLSKDLALLMINSYRLDLFEKIVSAVPQVSPTLVATTLEYTWKSLKREGVSLDQIDEFKLLELFRIVGQGLIAKEAIPEVLRVIAENPNFSVVEAIEKLGFKAVSLDEVRSLVDRIIEENAVLIEGKGERAFKLVMGKVMSILRGKIDGKLVSDIVKERVENFMRSRAETK